MPENLVRDLCLACGINFNELKVEILDEIWGQRKGGRVSKK